MKLLGIALFYAGFFPLAIPAALFVLSLRDPCRRLAGLPRFQVAAAPAGKLVVLRGHVVESGALPAPFSGLPSAWFELRLELCGPTRWHPVFVEPSSRALLLDDRSGERLPGPRPDGGRGDRRG